MFSTGTNRKVGRQADLNLSVGYPMQFKGEFDPSWIAIEAAGLDQFLAIEF
jgi:hypothetical protein